VSRAVPLRLAAVAERPLTVCTECGKCCTYVAVGVNAPNSVRRATDMLWYLFHENVTVYRDGGGEWSVVFETRCRNLQPDLRCSVYEHRPEICRSFDNTTCEINDPEGGLAINTPEQLMDYLRERRPRLFEKVEARFVPPAGFGAVPGTATRG
jgi:Fe-S-cluster containining protein